jgi:hypothetical protein
MAISLDQLRAAAPTLSQMMAEEEDEDSVMRFTDVQYGAEFYRIAGLPRREIPSQEDEQGKVLAEWLTGRLAKTATPYPGRMRVIQAIALKEAWENKGGIGMLRVGAGKTGVAFWLPEIWQAARPLIVTKAMMVKDMEAERRLMSKDWHIRPAHQCPIISYELLSAPSSGEVLDDAGNVIVKSRLERMAPTHIIFDEAHSLADSGSTAAKRVKAYLEAHPEVVVYMMTGTFFKKSIKDCCHLFGWALKMNSPLPSFDFKERETWASHLDARAPGAGGVRAGAGALLDFLSPEERLQWEVAGEEDPQEQIAIVRRAVARRILETPGVIGTQDPPLDIGLEVDNIQPADEDEDIEELFKILRGDPDNRDDYPGWRLPDGTEIPDGMVMARHCNTGGYGGYNIWDPDPPKEWRFARNQWSKWCRKAIQYNRKGIDSEARMKDSVRRGIVNDCWQEWETKLLVPPRPDLIGVSRLEYWEEKEAEERTRTGLREPPSVAVWVSEQIVEEVEAWLKSVGNGIVWVNSIGLGELLEERLNIPYYRAGGVDKNNRHIKQHPGGPAVASIKANGTGRNLQGFWHNNLWLTPPNEQALGRTHRAGQKAAVVRNWVYLGCQEHLKAFHSARATKAAFAEQMQLSPQKLRYAKTTMPTERELEARGGRRWASPKNIQED